MVTRLTSVIDHASLHQWLAELGALLASSRFLQKPLIHNEPSPTLPPFDPVLTAI